MSSAMLARLVASTGPAESALTVLSSLELPPAAAAERAWVGKIIEGRPVFARNCRAWQQEKVLFVTDSLHRRRYEPVWIREQEQQQAA